MWLDDLYEDRKIRASANGSGRSRSLLQLFLSKKWWCDMDVYTPLKYSRKAPAVQLFFGWNLFCYCIFAFFLMWWHKKFQWLYHISYWEAFCMLLLCLKKHLCSFFLCFIFSVCIKARMWGGRKTIYLAGVFFPHAPWDTFLFSHLRGLVHQYSWKLSYWLLCHQRGFAPLGTSIVFFLLFLP